VIFAIICAVIDIPKNGRERQLIFLSLPIVFIVSYARKGGTILHSKREESCPTFRERIATARSAVAFAISCYATIVTVVASGSIGSSRLAAHVVLVAPSISTVSISSPNGAVVVATFRVATASAWTIRTRPVPTILTELNRMPILMSYNVITIHVPMWLVRTPWPAWACRIKHLVSIAVGSQTVQPEQV
jgi:hypothetical protein